MLFEILHDLIDASAHHIGLDRARELHDLADGLDVTKTVSVTPAAPAPIPPQPKVALQVPSVPAGA